MCENLNIVLVLCGNIIHLQTYLYDNLLGTVYTYFLFLNNMEYVMYWLETCGAVFLRCITTRAAKLDIYKHKHVHINTLFCLTSFPIYDRP